MAEKYLRGMLGTMLHEYRTFASNILRIEQDPKTGQWRMPDKFLENVESTGLDKAVKNYIVPYKFTNNFALPNQPPVLSKKQAGQEETFRIVEDLYTEQNRSSAILAQKTGHAPLVDLKAISKAQNYKEQLKNPDIRRHLLAKNHDSSNAEAERTHAAARGRPTENHAHTARERHDNWIAHGNSRDHRVHHSSPKAPRSSVTGRYAISPVDELSEYERVTEV